MSAIEHALSLEDRSALKRACSELSLEILDSLQIAPIRLKVLTVRPRNNWGELHGEYEPAEGRRRALVTVWMRTAHHKNVVAFRTFLRTVLHELCHHIDYELFKLEDSFHTEGFFKRESSLFKQLVQ